MPLPTWTRHPFKGTLAHCHLSLGGVTHLSSATAWRGAPIVAAARDHLASRVERPSGQTHVNVRGDVGADSPQNRRKLSPEQSSSPWGYSTDVVADLA